MQVLVAPDKFRSTASAVEVADSIAHGCWSAGFESTVLPLADGGDGLIDVFGGANRSNVVSGPLGDPIEAGWRLADRVALIEMASASGLELIGGPANNRPMDASTAGTGELIMHAVRAGAKQVVVGLGGSATTDGGLGALDAIANPNRLAGVELIVAHDVDTMFVDAAVVFGPQKGASPAQVALLTRRLESLAERYITEFGVDVTDLPGSGAAGGLAGGLAAIGARLVPGFDFVSTELGFDEAAATSDVIITGEGHLDMQSFDGKVVGGVADIADSGGQRVIAIVGRADRDALDYAKSRRIAVYSLTELFGEERAFSEPRRCIELATVEALSAEVAD